MRLMGIISRRLQHLRVHGDLRLLIGTAEQKAEALRQIEKRSAAAKAGWAKRRAREDTRNAS